MEIEYIKILNLFMKMVEVNKGESKSDVENYLIAKKLAVKFIMHALSILHLSAKTVVPGLAYNVSFLDLQSMKVLSRASFESYLTFYFLFVNPKDESERRLRFMLWELDSLLPRQRITFRTKQGEQMLSKEKEKIENLKKEILGSQKFEEFSEKVREKFTKGKWRDCWRLGKSWKELGGMAGFSSTFSNDMYDDLAHTAHSGLRSVVSSGSLQDSGLISKFMQGVMSRFILDFRDIFPLSKGIYDLERSIDGDVNINPAFKSSGTKFAEIAQGATLVEIWDGVSKKELKGK